MYSVAVCNILESFYKIHLRRLFNKLATAVKGRRKYIVHFCNVDVSAICGAVHKPAPLQVLLLSWTAGHSPQWMR